MSQTLLRPPKWYVFRALPHQGVDLSNIVVSDGADIPLTIKHLQDLFGDDGKCKDVSASASLCDTLATECRKGLAERVLATERAAYPAIIRLVYHRRLTKQFRLTGLRSSGQTSGP